jgi:hypothetical protein
MRPNLLAPLVLAGALAAPASGETPGAPQLALPIACEPGRTCEIQHYVDRDPAPATRDYRCGLQTYEGHTGVDFRIPDMAAERRGVAVLAAAPGRVARLRDGVQDVSIRTPGAASVANVECGNGVVIDHGGGWETQYCHLARGSIVVKTGQSVQAGAPLAKVGLSGNTEFPHLHFTVRHAGKVVDPFAPDMSAPQSCKTQKGLWTTAAQARMPYKAGAILNTGFTAAQFSMDQLEAGGLPPATADSPVLIAYARAIALLPGDVVELVVKDPQGAILAETRRDPLVRWRAQDLVFVGKRRPAAGWAKGTYVAEYRVLRQGKPAMSRRFELRL